LKKKGGRLAFPFNQPRKRKKKEFSLLEGKKRERTNTQGVRHGKKTLMTVGSVEKRREGRAAGEAGKKKGKYFRRGGGRFFQLVGGRLFREVGGKELRGRMENWGGQSVYLQSSQKGKACLPPFLVGEGEKRGKLSCRSCRGWGGGPLPAKKKEEREESYF